MGITSTQEIISKPLLRWAGSKKKIIPILIKYWSNDFNRYIEPFVGSAQLFYSISPKKAILSDLNQELIESYKTISSHPKDVYALLIKMKVNKEEYYKLRAKNTDKLNEFQKAARFLYLNKYCFNGLYRTNNSGQFNVPFSNSEKPGSIVSYEAFLAASEKIKKAKVIHGDFEKIVGKNVRKGDFVYLDPPYAVANRKIFNQYGPQTFGLNDLKRLDDLLSHINKTGGSFLLSYAYCKESLKIANNWQSEKIFTQRNISGFAIHRRKAAELLISNIILK